MMKLRPQTPQHQFVVALLGATLASLLLYSAKMLHYREISSSYLVWNLFLAWIPLVVSVWLVQVLHRKLWSSWEAIAVTVLWLAFLPNSFYMISDFIHLADLSAATLLYSAVMFASFIFTAAILGFSSLYLVHRQLRRRLTKSGSWSVVAVVLLICSFGIYIGRDLRWNSWDLLVNPAGLLFALSESFFNVGNYGLMITTTLSFFVLLGSMYLLAWSSARLLHRIHP